MFIIFGTHLFGLKRYAYKYMGCSHCEMHRLFIQTRGFAWGHIFWIPLIPLGYQSSWHCASCVKEDNNAPTSFIVKLVFLAALIVAFYMVTLGKPAADLGDSALWWQGGIGLLLAWSLYETFYHFKKKEQNKYKFMMPLPDRDFCELCDGELEVTHNGTLQCADCKCYALDMESDRLLDAEVMTEEEQIKLLVSLDDDEITEELEELAAIDVKIKALQKELTSIENKSETYR